MPTPTRGILTRPDEITKEAVVNLLDRSLFRLWLESKQPTTIVGFCASSGTCPLAMYLYEMGVPNPIVDGKTVDWPSNPAYTEVSLPDWARAFVKQVDKLHFMVDSVNPPVTAAEALRVMATLP